MKTLRTKICTYVIALLVSCGFATISMAGSSDFAGIYGAFNASAGGAEGMPDGMPAGMPGGMPAGMPDMSQFADMMNQTGSGGGDTDGGSNPTVEEVD